MLAADGTGDFTVTGDSGSYSYADHVLTITGSGAVTVSGTTTQDRIQVKDGVNADLTLAGVSIDSSNAAIKIGSDAAAKATAKITLQAGTTNTLKGGYLYAGLQVLAAAGVVITGTGTLNATGSLGGAGIGGSPNGSTDYIDRDTYSGGTITIDSGIINAKGGAWCAGIGGGRCYQHGYPCDNSGTITINGGTIFATGQNYSAGIGGSQEGDGGTIVINGGTIDAAYDTYSEGRAACIGHGYYFSGSSTSTLKNKAGTNVYLHKITLEGVPAGTAVTGVTTNLSEVYGADGMVTADGGVLFLYLP